MNWSIDRRFSRGLFLTPALLGYDKDEEGNLVINPEEAQTVKVIYYLYLNGYSLTEIATLLMEYDEIKEKIIQRTIHYVPDYSSVVSTSSGSLAYKN